jgi:hypothetical protein
VGKSIPNAGRSVVIAYIGRNWNFVQLIIWKWFPWNPVFAVNPVPQIDKLTAFGAERAKGVIFPGN